MSLRNQQSTISLVKQISDICISSNRTLSVAESCTGGLIGGAITALPGVSRFFRGGVIAYENEIKRNILKVPKIALEKYGAVSSQTVLAMATGVKKLFKTDYSIAVSGIAGPDGGTKEKPVGLVWIGISTSDSTRAFRHVFRGNRSTVRSLAVKNALQLLIKQIK
jgi:PncC family amidohydrolase